MIATQPGLFQGIGEKKFSGVSKKESKNKQPEKKSARTSSVKPYAGPTDPAKARLPYKDN